MSSVNFSSWSLPACFMGDFIWCSFLCALITINAQSFSFCILLYTSSIQMTIYKKQHPLKSNNDPRQTNDSHLMFWCIALSLPCICLEMILISKHLRGVTSVWLMSHGCSKIYFIKSSVCTHNDIESDISVTSAIWAHRRVTFLDL